MTKTSEGFAFHWTVRAVALAMGALFFTLSGGDLRAEALGAEGMACQFQCASGGPVCPDGGHKLFKSGHLDAGGEFHEQCNEGSCSEYHACTPDPDGLDETVASLEALVSAADSTGLADLIARHESVSINSARRAVQVTGCQDTVLVHRAVPGDLLSALQEQGSR